MHMMRRLISLFLMLTMVATTGAMASMRDRDAGAQSIVICTGHGPQLILLGADGEPVERAPICPDCTMVLEAGPLPLLTIEAREGSGTIDPAPDTAQTYIGPLHLLALARAPPVLAL